MRFTKEEIELILGAIWERDYSPSYRFYENAGKGGENSCKQQPSMHDTAATYRDPNP